MSQRIQRPQLYWQPNAQISDVPQPIERYLAWSKQSFYPEELIDLRGSLSPYLARTTDVPAGATHEILQVFTWGAQTRALCSDQNGKKLSLLVHSPIKFKYLVRKKSLSKPSILPDILKKITKLPIVVYPTDDEWYSSPQCRHIENLAIHRVIDERFLVCGKLVKGDQGYVRYLFTIPESLRVRLLVAEGLVRNPHYTSADWDALLAQLAQTGQSLRLDTSLLETALIRETPDQEHVVTQPNTEQFVELEETPVRPAGTLPPPPVGPLPPPPPPSLPPESEAPDESYHYHTLNGIVREALRAALKVANSDPAYHEQVNQTTQSRQGARVNLNASTRSSPGAAITYIPNGLPSQIVLQKVSEREVTRIGNNKRSIPSDGSMPRQQSLGVPEQQSQRPRSKSPTIDFWQKSPESTSQRSGRSSGYGSGHISPYPTQHSPGSVSRSDSSQLNSCPVDGAGAFSPYMRQISKPESQRSVVTSVSSWTESDFSHRTNNYDSVSIDDLESLTLGEGAGVTVHVNGRSEPQHLYKFEPVLPSTDKDGYLCPSEARDQYSLQMQVFASQNETNPNLFHTKCFNSLQEVPIDLDSLSVEEVGLVLSMLNLDQHRHNFACNMIDGAMLMDFTSDDFRDLGLSPAQCTRLNKFVKGWRPKL